MSLDLVFCGTPAFAVPTLERLHAAGSTVRLVVTQPDRPRGRGMEIAAPPVKEAALRLRLPLAQPEKIKLDQEFRAQLEALQPAAIVVVGYGKLIPKWMLELPRLGNINLHASLLPKYRGAAPIQWAIARGETTSGNTTMLLNEGLDTGDILLQQPLEIHPQETAVAYGRRLATGGADLMIETLNRLAGGAITPQAQDHSQATLAPVLQKDDGLMEFSRSAQELFNRWRGFQPWPGAFTTFRGRQLKVISAAVAAARPVASPLPEGGLALVADALLCGCGGGSLLELVSVQLEGKKAMSGRDFANGHRLQPRERLGA